MKYKISIIALLISAGSLMVAESYADGQGFYVGASAGYSGLNTPTGDVFYATPTNVGPNHTPLVMETGESNDVGGFGGSLFSGYNINSIMAVELGYTAYGTSKYSTDQAQYIDVPSGGFSYDSTNSASIKYSTYSLDLFLKATTPTFGPFSAFAKAGVSYVNQSVDYQNPAGAPIINVNNNTLATPDSGSNSYTAYRPAGGLGVNYKINEHLTSSFFAQGFLGRGDMETDKDAIASGYLIGASLTYNFI